MVIRDVLRDILVAVKMVNDLTAAMREEMYWGIYNASLLALRVSRRLRLCGFGGVGAPTLWWLSQTISKYLPLMGVHMLPFRTRFQQELAYCAESVAQLGEAQRICKAAVEQIEKARDLETVLPPVPEETQKIFDGLLSRFRILKIKYDFWIGELPDARAAWAQAEQEGGAGHAIACLLEALSLHHDLPSHIGGEVADEVTGPPGDDSALPEGAPSVSRLTHSEVHTKQCDLLDVLAEKVQPQLEKVEAATKELDDFTRRRLAYEEEEERRARQLDADVPPPGDGDGGAEVERPEEPEPPTTEQLSELGFQSDGAHSIEDALPLSAHALLLRESLRHEILSKGERLSGVFKMLERYLALRVRYRHFLSPPLVDVDVIQTQQRVREKVEVPDKYDVITEDLNALALRNRQGDEGEGGADAAGGMGELHVFVIAQRYNAWEKWTNDHTVKVERICNLRIVFADQTPKVRARSDAASLGLFGRVPGDVSAVEAPKPWLEPYASGNAADFSHFDHVQETTQATQDLLQQLTAAGHITHPRSIPLPIERHPGAPKNAVTPYLVFSKFEEQSLAAQQDESLAPELRTLLPSDTEAVGEAGQDAEEQPPADSEELLPPWCPVLEDVLAATLPVTDIAIFASKHIHAVVPNPRFNAVVRCDLRQTPHELRGRAFQTYIFLCSAVRAPSLVSITRQLRACRAAHALHLAGSASASAGDQAAPTEGEGDGERWQQPPLMNRLVEFAECIGRLVSGHCGQLYLLDSADLLEDLCSHAFLTYVWPKLRFLQDAMLRHEQGERMLREHDQRDVAEWSSVMRRVVPVLLRVLSEVQALDGITLGSAALALAKLFVQANDGGSARVELGSAIARLEAEMAESLGTLGQQPAHDLPVAAAVSFDPPSLRAPEFAFFEGEKAEGAAGSTLVLKRHERLEQDRFCLLARLYEQWLDSSLKTHLKDVNSTVRRVVRPSERDEVDGQSGADGSATRLALSNPEAAVLARLGENPYLRCLFFTAVARRRPDAAAAALSKACRECEAAVSQEAQLWAFCEAELVRHQEALRANTEIGEELTRKQKPGRKISAHTPLLLARSPHHVRLRVPPLPGSHRPPMLASAVDFSPPGEVMEHLGPDGGDGASSTAAAVRRWHSTLSWAEWTRDWHSQQLGVRSASTTNCTCAVFAKPCGARTAVSEMHCDLPGSGIRRGGYEYVEIGYLKPNTNYSFATMYYEGFEAARPAASTVSESSPPIGTYYPLPIALLRVEVCKESLKAGKVGEPSWRRMWPSLLDSFCESSHEQETYDAYGVRAIKLRLDVADRMPPVVLSAFAELVLLRHTPRGGQRHGDACPVTRGPQEAVLRATNECLVAADCARRALNSELTFRGVARVLSLISPLLQYRTKPHQLYSVLVKCAVLLDAFDPKTHDLAWHAKTRSAVIYLLHQVSVMCIQLQQVTVLASIHTDNDVIERYAANVLAHQDRHAVANSNVLDHALELALLGGPLGLHADEKAALVLKNQEGSAEIIGLLKDVSERGFDKVVREAAQLVLQQQERDEEQDGSARLAASQQLKPLSALSLLRCAASRVWANAAGVPNPAAAPPPPPPDPKAKKGEPPPAAETNNGDLNALAETLAEVLTKHKLGNAMDKYIDSRRAALEDFGFLLRALPVARMQRTPEVDEEAEPPADAQADAGATMLPGEDSQIAADLEKSGEVASAPEPLALLSESGDAAALSHLEMMRAAPSLTELQGLNLHWHDISRFRFLDLQQVAEELPSTGDDAAGGETEEDPLMDSAAGADIAGAGEAGEEVEPWKRKELEDRENRKRALDLLKQALRPLARAAVYAYATGADQLLFTSSVAALNALLLVGPMPSECVPVGPKANPMDTDPDNTVGVPPPQPPAEGEEEQAPAEDVAAGSGADDQNALWINIAIIAQSLVAGLRRLQARAGGHSGRSAADVGKVAGKGKAQAQAAQQGGLDGEGDEAETQALSDAKEAADAMKAADEELHDLWFQDMASFDVGSAAKFVAFAALCLYHMQRWNSVIELCRNFNDVTCSIYATTFLKLAIGAQGEVCKLSRNAITNTERYLVEAKQQFVEQKNALPRKLVRQLALQGALSEPEKLYNERVERYNKILTRQRRLESSWTSVLKAMNTAFDLADRVVPIAVKQLTRSRALLAKYLEDKRKFLLDVHRGRIRGAQQAATERAQRLAAMALVSSYRKSVELLRKRQVTDKVVQALHELGNLQWLEGDATGAQTSWSDAVDVTFQYVYAIKNWRNCLETSVSPPSSAERAELMLLTIVILAKHARLTMPRDMSAHLSASLFASGVVEAVLGSGLPHPCERLRYAPDRYRLREIFLGLRETDSLLTSSSLHGGLDGVAFCSALSFFHKTLAALEYQPERCLPICSLFNHVATGVCRSRRLATRSRLLAAQALVRCRSFGSAWRVLFALSRNHDMPRPLLANETLDALVVDSRDAADTAPFADSEEPYSEGNMQAVNTFADFILVPEDDAQASVAIGFRNGVTFSMIQAEFLVTLCSYGRLALKLDDPESVCRKGWLDKAESKLQKIWKEVTGNEDDIDAWEATSPADSGAGAAAASVTPPARALAEEDRELVVQTRLLRAWIWELRGDLGRAIKEILHGMRFMQQEVSTSGASRIIAEGADNSEESELWSHSSATSWMLLRQRMVHLLVAQGRIEAASAHIEEGIRECMDLHDDVSLVWLLATKVRVDIQRGVMLEVHGTRRLGAVPTAERCLAVASKDLLAPTPSVVYARVLLCQLYEQNPLLKEADVPPSDKIAAPEVGDENDPYQQLLLEAAGQVIISPLARIEGEFAKEAADAVPAASPSAAERGRDVTRRAAESVRAAIEDIDRIMRARNGPSRAAPDELHPGDMNFLFRSPGDPSVNSELKILPRVAERFRDRPVSDTRPKPNVYLTLAPLRLRCELILARLLLDMGNVDEAEVLMKESELRMARSVMLLPWLHVEFAVLKLRWRRLCLETGKNKVSVPTDAPNNLKYRDPRAFEAGVCPSADSPLFRTFLSRAKVPSMTDDSQWMPRSDEDMGGLDGYLEELLGVVRTSIERGGHDYNQLLALFREGIEESLRVRASGAAGGAAQADGGDEPAKAGHNQLYALFACAVAVAECRKGLQFLSNTPPPPEDPKAKDPKGGAVGPVAVDSKALPPRVISDLQHNLKRQASEGGLAYGAGALQELQAAVPFRVATRHANALRRECDSFSSLFQSERVGGRTDHVPSHQRVR
eukprot:TRINITY_DN14900_c0_g2_i2.p1 TRINITY_DN14900_c0_g2~~TRINITY_DN14900_c0_g2_i2.p1  ORF type:complete len:3483 (-),score=804.97 TRINITY_DN14900_c0_g2_i2:72-9770(-)